MSEGVGGAFTAIAASPGLVDPDVADVQNRRHLVPRRWLHRLLVRGIQCSAHRARPWPEGACGSARAHRAVGALPGKE